MQFTTNMRFLLGAVFLMATAAVGPGFLTQTTLFTEQIAASFAFVILVTIILDIGVQLNVWRIIAVTKLRVQDIANRVFPGLGYVVAGLVVLGGLAFNIANIGGAGLGTNVVFDTPISVGAVISAFIATMVFLISKSSKVMDYVVMILGVILIGLTLYVAITAAPPMLEVAKNAVWPEEIDVLIIVTIVGGTVGGYITYAGGHRLLEAGISGKEALPSVSKSAALAIGLASLVRILLFLATLGVLAKGFSLNPENPAASVFELATSRLGHLLFGIVMWSAAMSSIIASAYTSVSFLQSLHPWIERNRKFVTISFILISTVVFVIIKQPVYLLVLAGVINGFILPITLGVMLIAAYKRNIVGDYAHPIWMGVFGAVIVIVMGVLAIYTVWKYIFTLLR